MVESWLESLRSRARRVLAGFTNGPRPGAGPEPMREDALWTDPPPPVPETAKPSVDSGLRRAEQIVALQSGLGESTRASGHLIG